MKKRILKIIGMLFVLTIVSTIYVLCPLHYKVEYSGNNEIPENAIDIESADILYNYKKTDIYISQSTGNQSSMPWVYGAFYSPKKAIVFVTEPEEPKGIVSPAIDRHLLKVTVPLKIKEVEVVKVSKITVFEIGKNIVRMIKIHSGDYEWL